MKVMKYEDAEKHFSYRIEIPLQSAELLFGAVKSLNTQGSKSQFIYYLKVNGKHNHHT